MRCFLNVDLNLHFQGHLLQELDGRQSVIIVVKT